MNIKIQQKSHSYQHILATTFIFITQSYFNTYSNLQSVILTISFAQPTIFVITNIHDKESDMPHLKYLDYLVRPLKFDNDKYTDLYVIYGFTILLLINIISFFYQCKIMQNKLKKSYRQNQINNLIDTLPYYVRVTLKIFAFQNILIYYILYVPFIEILLIKFKLLVTINVNINIFFDLICIIIIIITITLYSILAAEAPQLQKYGFQLINQTLLSPFKIIIQSLQIIIYVYTDNEQVGTYIQSILMIIYTIISLCDSIFNYPYSNPKFYKIILFFSGFQITSAFFNIIFQTLLYSEELTVLLGSLLLIYIFIDYFDRITLSNLFINNTSSPQALQYRLSILIHEFGNYSENRAILVGLHRKSCKNIKCFCHKHLSSLDLFTVKQDKYYLFLVRKQIHYFGNLIQKRKQFQINFFFHYIFCLSYIGQATNAFQQLSFLKSTKSQQNNRFKTRMESSQYQSITNDTRSLNARFALQQRNSSDQSMNHIQSQNELDYVISPISQIQVTFIDSAKYDNLMAQVRQSIEINLSSLNQEQSELSQMIQIFIQSEQNSYQIYTDVIQFIQDKINYIKLLQMEYINGDKLLIETKKFNIKCEKYEQLLQRQYDQFPSEKIQNILAFHQAEIRNNYFTAYKTVNIQSIKEDKVSNFLQQYKFDFFSKQIAYLNILLDVNNQLEIKQSSMQAYKIFGFDKNKFSQITELNQLLPKCIIKIHKLFLEEFLENGQAKYYTQQNLSYSINQYGLIQQIDLFFDINFQETRQFGFIAFVSLNNQRVSQIFVKSDGYIGGISYNLLSRMNLVDRAEDILILIHKISIDTLLPDFDKLLLLKDYSQQTQEMYTLLDEMTIEKEDVTFYFFNPQIRSTLTLNRQDLQSQLLLFSANIRIRCRLIKQQCYYIVDIIDFKQSFSSRGISINFSAISKKDEFDDSQLFQSDDFNRPNIPQALYCQDLIFQRDENQVCGKLENVQFEPNQEALVSPHSTQRQFLENQQQFYKGEEEEPQNENQKSSACFHQYQGSVEPQNQIAKIDRQFGDQEQVQNILMSFYQDLIKEKSDIDKFNNDQQSQIQSLSAFKASKYFSKYTFFNKIITQQYLLTESKLSFIGLFSIIILLIVYQLLILILSYNDFELIRKQINFLKIRKMVMGPLSATMAAELVKKNYDQLLETDQINQDQYNQYLQYTQETRIAQSNLMKEYFQYMLLNSDISYYLYTTASLGYIVDNPDEYPTEFEMNLGEVMQNLLASQYQQQYNYKNDRIMGPINLIYFCLANYAGLFEQIEEFGHSFLLFTQNTSVRLNNNWQLISLVFLCFTICSLIFSIYYAFATISINEKILEFKCFINQEVINKELDRLEILAKIIENKKTIIYQYNFNLDVKEDYLKILEKKSIFNQTKIQKQRVNLRKSKIKTLLYYIFILIFLITYIISTLEISNLYFNSYHDTTEYLFSTSEIISIISTTYIVKELAYDTSKDEYRYLGDEAKTELLEICEECIGHYNEFLELAYHIKTINLLGGDNFKSMFNYYQGNDLCQIFDEDYKQIAEYLCTNSLEGNLRLGFLPSMLYIRQQLSEDLENGFSERNYSQFPINQVEGALTLSDAMSILAEQLSIGLDNVTQSTQYVQYTITLSALIVVSIYALILIIISIENAYQNQVNLTSFLAQIPIYTMVLEGQYERALRLFCLKLGWV